MRYLLLILICIESLCLGGCFGSSRPPIRDTIKESPAEDKEDAGVRDELSNIMTLEEARAYAAQLAARSEAMRARARAAEELVKKKEAERQAERMARLQASAYWAAGILMFVAIICVAAAIFLEAARKILFTGALAALGGMVMALTLAEFMPYAKWIGIGGGGVGLLGLLWYFYRLRKIHTEEAQVGVQALYELDLINSKKAEKIKDDAVKRQLKNGIQNDVHRKVIKIKEKNGYKHEPRAAA